MCIHLLRLIAMGVEAFGTRTQASFKCNTTNQTFGPIHYAVGGSAIDELNEFIGQLDTDARVLASKGLLNVRLRAWQEQL